MVVLSDIIARKIKGPDQSRMILPFELADAFMKLIDRRLMQELDAIGR